MTELLLAALGGFLASLVDGALGMGFGPTSSSILLAAGVSPTATSATVNLAKIVTGLSSALAHRRLGNVDRWLLVRLAGFGALGAVLGAVALSSVDDEVIRPLLAVLLLASGLRLAVRFARPGQPSPVSGGAEAVVPPVGAALVGVAGGVSNGMVGAWGPLVTPYLLHRRVQPRVVAGTVNTAEVVVAGVAAGSLLGMVGGAGVDGGVVVAMLAGGVLAAPLAARVVHVVPARALGLTMASLLLVTQSLVLAAAVGAVPTLGVLVGLSALVGLGLVADRFRSNRDRLVTRIYGERDSADRGSPAPASASTERR